MASVKSNYAREIVYVISCMDKKSGRIAFFALDDFSKYIFPLGVHEVVNDETYEAVLLALLNDKTFVHAKGKFNLVVGFGEQACRNLAPRINAMHGNIEYDPDQAIAESWPFIQIAFKESTKVDFKPVSLFLKKIDTWINFLNPHFIRKAIPIPKEFSRISKDLLTEFKAQFVSGVDHVAFVDQKSTQRIMGVSDKETEALIAELQEVPSHNGIIYLDQGNGFNSDFIYRLTHFEEGTHIVCFRQDSKMSKHSMAIAICSFKRDRTFVLHTPSGIGDSYNTARLISVVMRPKKVLADVYVNFNPDMVGSKMSGIDLISVAKYLYVGNQS